LKRLPIHMVTVLLLGLALTGAVDTSAQHATNDRWSFSGYGEMHYNIPSNDTAELDFHRLVFGFGYQFNDNISLHAELDFEHAFTEPEVEFAYLDFFYKEPLSFRAGMMLMPVGPLNEFHEPTLFYSVERPHVQKYVIPTTWQEPGAGVVGTLADGTFGYRAYVVGGLDASAFRASDGIRKGRQKAAEAKAEDLAVVGRVEYSPVLNLTAGASGYFGGASHGDDALGDATVGMVEADALVKYRGFELRGVGVMVFIGDADSISTNNSTGSTVGEQIMGGYAEAAFRVLSQLRSGSQRDVVLFARFEKFDTHHEVAEGFVAAPEFDREIITVGAAFFPIPDVALKTDFEFWETGDGSSWEQINLGLGFTY